uniref:ABC-type amino acid transport/signal transduction system n=1 Tax=Rheinheimera sp. BAL341 TaxID=1708203 RepID=A0A486XGT2_9GAMM
MHLIALFCSLLVSLPFTVAAKQIIVAGDNWCPINCGANETKQGYMIEVARQALAREGYELVYQEMPWARAVALARRGDIDAVVGAFKGDAPDFHFPKQAILSISPNHLFSLKDKPWRYHGVQSLDTVRLGTIVGYDYGELLNAYIAAADEPRVVKQLSGDDAVPRNIAFLLRGRTDVLVEAAPVLWYHAKKMGVAAQLMQVGMISPAEPCFVAFAPGKASSKQLANALDRGLLHLQQHNLLAAIASRYGLDAEQYHINTVPQLQRSEDGIEQH